MAKLDSPTLDALTERVMWQLAFHSETIAPPSGYQFVLPDGRYLSLNDYLIKGRRSILFSSMTSVARPTRQVSSVLAMPRKVPQEGAWFAGYTERQLRSAAKTVRYAIDFAYRNNDNGRVDSMLLIDPAAQPQRVERPADWKPAAASPKETP